MWQYILISVSALLFFGFVILGVLKYGLLSCYSAYGPKWDEAIPSFNIWSLITIVSAFLMVPVLLECSVGNPYQFLGFLAPASLTLVGISPDYQTNKFANVLHQIGAWGAVLFVTLYVIAMTNLLWVVLALMIISVALGILEKGTWMFWGEMAMYLSIYIILYCLI